MLAPIALALSIAALLLAAGAFAMTIKQTKSFESLRSTVRQLEEKPPPVAESPRINDRPPTPKAEPTKAEPTKAEPPPSASARPKVSPSDGLPAPGSRGEVGSESATAPAPREPVASSREPDPIPSPKKPEPPPADPKWQAWLDQLRTLPHGSVAALLGEVLQHSKHLALGFADPAQRAAFASEVGEGFQRRLTRFQQCARDEATFVERWVEPDLVTALDLLARFQSQAAADARDGHSPAGQLAAWLATALYEQLGPACQAEGWFALDAIAPFHTTFDPQLHKGIDGRAVAGARGLVVEVERVGRLHPLEGYPLDKAHVVVGR